MQKDLINRMDSIAKSASSYDDCLAVLALGSIGVELERLDEYSDLDFFIITTDDSKQRFIDDLTWLSQAYPLGYTFRNTSVGYKFFFKDGIYGEFAVFGLSEVPSIHQSKGRIIWHRQGVEIPNLASSKGAKPKLKSNDSDFNIQEGLTNIYVGLMRYKRGEKLSAYQFIETHAFNNLLKVLHCFEEEKAGFFDDYNIQRRFEQHYPNFAPHLSTMLLGYDRLVESAYNMYQYIKQYYDVHDYLKSILEELFESLHIKN
jgi:lincosamide nucleotidyltransferase B/F